MGLDNDEILNLNIVSMFLSVVAEYLDSGEYLCMKENTPTEERKYQTLMIVRK